MSLCFNCQQRKDFCFTKDQCVGIFNVIQQGLGSAPTFDHVVAYIVASGQDSRNLPPCIQSNSEGYVGDTRGGLRRLALVIALYMVLGGLIPPQHSRTVGDHFNQLLHLQHTQLATPTAHENVHFITRKHPVGRWMCAFTKDYLEIIRGTESDKPLQQIAYGMQDDEKDEKDKKMIEKADEIFKIVREEYLSGIDRLTDTDSKTLLDSVPVYVIDSKLRDSCFPEGNPSVALQTQAALHCAQNDIICKASMQSIADQVDRLGPFGGRFDDWGGWRGCFTAVPGLVESSSARGKWWNQQNSTTDESEHRQGPIVLVWAGLDSESFEAVLLHELMHAIHARVQMAQHILALFDYELQRLEPLMTSPLTETETKMLTVAQNFHSQTSQLMTKIYEHNAYWAPYWTKSYWLSDIEMVPHLATVSLAVKSDERKKLLVGPAVDLYKMYMDHPDIQPDFQACFAVLEEMKKIPSDGLHDAIPGLTRTRINYQSIGAADYAALRYLGPLRKG